MNAWPLAGVGAFVLGHSSSVLVTVVAIEQLREGGLEAMSGVGNFTKTLEIGAVVLGKGTHKTFVVGPGEALWLPSGYLPLVTGITRGDDDEKEAGRSDLSDAGSFDSDDDEEDGGSRLPLPQELLTRRQSGKRSRT